MTRAPVDASLPFFFFRLDRRHFGSCFAHPARFDLFRFVALCAMAAVVTPETAMRSLQSPDTSSWSRTRLRREQRRANVQALRRRLEAVVDLEQPISDLQRRLAIAAPVVPTELEKLRPSKLLRKRRNTALHVPGIAPQVIARANGRELNAMQRSATGRAATAQQVAAEPTPSTLERARKQAPWADFSPDKFPLASDATGACSEAGCAPTAALISLAAAPDLESLERRLRSLEGQQGAALGHAHASPRTPPAASTRPVPQHELLDVHGARLAALELELPELLKKLKTAEETLSRRITALERVAGAYEGRFVAVGKELRTCADTVERVERGFKNVNSTLGRLDAFDEQLAGMVTFAQMDDVRSTLSHVMDEHRNTSDAIGDLQRDLHARFEMTLADWRDKIEDLINTQTDLHWTERLADIALAYTELDSKLDSVLDECKATVDDDNSQMT